ncbi:arginase family protein [Candidatus Nephthysia bennettiae]|uniref:Arginase family protein n=1 Tax=Candidatus Nephthysia bennettiae TaxID=3127016 RepID=A0A934K656_9BACT|nr:arginase family protein [Candidatus Dormibacteraeota bacterium]MBJ7613670.1 arginase family protein [Candidatus Dormibacteraeota bacterium]
MKQNAVTDPKTISLTVVGVPTSAGAHHAGQDLAPAALRARGFVDKLAAAGLVVIDAGDVAGEVFASDDVAATARNLDAVVAVALAVADAVEREVRAGRMPIVLGGDCTITVGVVAGLQRVHDEVRLAYFDGDADLNSPERTRSGILDATGVAHLLGIADTPLARIGRSVPMLAEHQLVLLGYDPTDPDSYDADALTGRPTLKHFTDAAVSADPDDVARQVVAALANDNATIAVHFDVDAVDSRDLPLANFPHYGTGVSLAAAGQVLETLLAAPGANALILTEVNPTHDPAGTQLDRYIETVTQALARGVFR